MDLVEIGLGELDWIGLAQYSYRWRAPVNSVGNLSSEEWRLLGCYAMWLL
jgi:hypothetical protein